MRFLPVIGVVPETAARSLTRRVCSQGASCGLHLVLSPAARFPAPSRLRHFVILPLSSMLFQVRLQYAIHVDASDKSQAYRLACKALREQPGSHIARVEQAGSPKGNPSLIKRIMTGQ
ncbi:MAG: hypothetical protein KDA86_23865 [Planctomycetaceae bacterium]|nr:hypothetical protein [Planctomycetaceae bacterium]